MSAHGSWQLKHDKPTQCYMNHHSTYRNMFCLQYSYILRKCIAESLYFTCNQLRPSIKGEEGVWYKLPYSQEIDLCTMESFTTMHPLGPANSSYIDLSIQILMVLHFQRICFPDYLTSLVEKMCLSWTHGVC